MNERKGCGVVNPSVNWLGELEDGLGAIDGVAGLGGDAGGALHMGGHLVGRIYPVMQVVHGGEASLTLAAVMFSGVALSASEP